MTVNPELDVLADKIEVAAYLAECLKGETQAVGIHGWATILGDLNRLSQTIASATRTAVTEARKTGYTWEQVGDCLGTTRQGAHQRFGGVK